MDRDLSNEVHSNTAEGVVPCIPEAPANSRHLAVGVVVPNFLEALVASRRVVRAVEDALSPMPVLRVAGDALSPMPVLQVAGDVD